MINYLKTNKKWYKNKKSTPESDDEDNKWDDWIDNSRNESVKCLFCDNNYENLDDLKKHLTDLHSFDFDKLDQFSFYKKVQLVNYIRNRISNLECINCDLKFEAINLLNDHLLESKHNCLPDDSRTSSLSHFQPVIENDLLLRLIDVDDLTDELDSKLVIPE